jgi:hypothetical protein
LTFYATQRASFLPHPVTGTGKTISSKVHAKALIEKWLLSAQRHTKTSAMKTRPAG